MNAITITEHGFEVGRTLRVSRVTCSALAAHNLRQRSGEKNGIQ